MKPQPASFAQSLAQVASRTHWVFVASLQNEDEPCSQLIPHWLTSPVEKPHPTAKVQIFLSESKPQIAEADMKLRQPFAS